MRTFLSVTDLIVLFETRVVCKVLSVAEAQQGGLVGLGGGQPSSSRVCVPSLGLDFTSTFPVCSVTCVWGEIVGYFSNFCILRCSTSLQHSFLVSFRTE